MSGDVMVVFLQDSDSGIYSDIGKYMEENDDSFTESTSSGIERAATSKYAFMGEYSVLDASIARRCDLTMMREQFYTGRWAFIMRQGWKYKDELDET